MRLTAQRVELAMLPGRAESDKSARYVCQKGRHLARLLRELGCVRLLRRVNGNLAVSEHRADDAAGGASRDHPRSKHGKL